MPFDTKIWQIPAKQGDVAGVAINIALAIRNLNLAILAVSQQKSPLEHLDEASKCAEELHAIFREMTGYTPSGE